MNRLLQVVLSGSNNCTLCGGTANSGGIGFKSNKRSLVSQNGSYILPNGIIVISKTDYDLQISGKIKFSDIDIIETIEVNSYE